MKDTIVRVIFFFLAYIGISIVCSIPFMLLWNWLMPDIFGLRQINLLEAFGLAMMSAILFKSNYSGKQ